MSTSQLKLLKNEIQSRSISHLGLCWQSHTDDFGRKGQKLVSDIGDAMGSIWVSKKGIWHTYNAQPCKSLNEAKALAKKAFLARLEFEVEKLNFFLSTSTSSGCIVQLNRSYGLFSIERAVIEESLTEIISSMLETLIANLNPRTEATISIRLRKISIPYSARNGVNIIMPQRIAIYADTLHSNHNSIKTFSWLLGGLSDAYLNALEIAATNFLQQAVK